MVINKIRLNENSRRVQKPVQQTQQGNGLTGIMPYRNPSHEICHMAPLRISFLIRSVYDLLPSNANLVRWGKKEDPTCPLCQGRQTTEHVLSSWGGRGRGSSLNSLCYLAPQRVSTDYLRQNSAKADSPRGKTNELCAEYRLSSCQNPDKATSQKACSPIGKAHI